MCKFSSGILCNRQNVYEQWACIMMKKPPQIAVSYEQRKKNANCKTQTRAYCDCHGLFFISWNFILRWPRAWLVLLIASPLKRWCNPIIRNVLQFSITCAIRNVTEHLFFVLHFELFLLFLSSPVCLCVFLCTNIDWAIPFDRWHIRVEIELFAISNYFLSHRHRKGFTAICVCCLAFAPF